MALDGGSVEIRFEGDVSPLRRSVEEAVESLDNVTRAAEEADKQLSSSSFSGFGKKAKQEFEEFADSATNAFVKVIDNSNDLNTNLKSIGESLKSIGLGSLTAGLATAAAGLTKMAKASISDTSALENTQIQMIGLTDSVEKGNKAMAMAVQYFKNNPFNRFDVTSATKNLIQFGAELDEIPSLLDKLGKVALSTGQSIDNIAYYYQRNISDGRVATRDLLQMQQNGIPIFGALAKQMGVTTGAIRELTAQGKVSIEDFQKAFDSLVSDEAMERFNNTLSRQMDRFRGRLSNIRAAIAGYTTDINNGLVISEQGLYRAVTKLYKTFSDIMDSETGQRLYQGFEKIGNAIAQVIDKISALLRPALSLAEKTLNFIGDNSELLIPIIGGLTVALTRFGSGLPVIGKFLEGVNTNFGKLYTGIKNIVSTHPMLSALIALLSVGFMEAYKNDEEFRKTIIELGQALKDIISNLMDAVRGVLPVFVNLIKELASSGVIKGILQAVAGALKVIAQAIASVPPEALAGLMSFILSLKLLNANPIMFAVTAITLLIQYIKELGGISKFFEKLPETLNTIGHNIMTGLFNGIKEGASKVVSFVRQVASSIATTFRNLLGIHSPSTVMYEIGQNIGLGLANGIEDSSSAVQVAMDNLAEDILKLSEKVISNKVDFGILDIKGEYQEWKKVSKLFTQGSEQYNYALEKMEEARKKANLQILSLQKSYNDALDNTISKIANMYGLLDDVNLKAGKNAQQILKGLDQQVAKMQEWASAQETISGLGLDAGLVEELQAMGIDATSELSAIANMTSDELSTLNDMWLKKQSIANKAGVKQMEGLKNDTLDQINDLKRGIDGVTVDVADVGGRLVENISEGVYGAMPTLQSAFSQLNDYILKAQKELAKGVGGGVDAGGAGGGDDLGVPDAGVVLKEEIQASMEKLKSMLPNILLGAIGAWGAFKFGPKILSAIGNKLFNKGGDIAESLSGTLFKLAKGGKLGKVDLEGLVDALFANSTEGSNSQKIISKIQDKLKGIGTDGKLVQSAGEMAKSTKATKTIAESSTQLSQNIQTTGQSFAKANSWMNSIREGAKTVIYIAGAIAAVAGALWITYNALKDVDFLKLAGQLVMMGVAVAEFGALAKVADILKISAKSILIIVGIAVDITAVAVACRIAYEAMKDIPWDGFGSMLGMMASAIGAFGLLNGILGIKVVAIAEGLGLLVSAGIIVEIVVLSKSIREAYETMKNIEWEGFGNMLGMMASALGTMGALNAPLGALIALEALGWASVMFICDELIKVAQALKVVEQNVPADFGALEKKLYGIKRTLEIINGLDLGTVIGLMVTSWSAGPVERIMDMYLHVAEILNRLSTINLNKEAIEANLDYIKSTLDSIKSKTDVISAWLEASALDMEASTIENAGRIVIVYGDMVDALNKLSNFTPDEAKISASLLAMVGVITLLRNSSYGGGGLFTIFNDMGTVANDVEKIKSIVKNYLEMVPTFQDLGKSENQIGNKLATTVQDNIKNIKDIVLTIGSVDTGGWIEQKEKDVGKIQSILNKFTEIAQTTHHFSREGYNVADGAIKYVQGIKELVKEIGSVDTAGWIDQKHSDMGKIQSILNKFTEIAQTTHHFGREGYSIADGAIKYIQDVRHLVWEIGQINQSEAGSLDAKAEIIEKSKTIARKLGEFANILNELKTVDNNSLIGSLTGALSQLLDGISTSLSEKTVVFENIGMKIGQSLAQGVKSQNIEMQLAGFGLQSSLWYAIESKMNDEFEQGKWMATRFGEGLKSVNFDNIGAQMQSSLWWAIQHRMNDEYLQGRAMGERFRQGLYDIDYANSGWWAVQGFINGVHNRAYSGSAIWWEGHNLADEFLRGLKARSGEGSPWKTTIKSGNWAVEGLIEGIKEQESALVGEATNLADEVINALTMDNLTMSPTLDATTLAPSMGEGEYGIIGGNGREVVINQQNDVYTEVDMDRVSTDLAWRLSKV